MTDASAPIVIKKYANRRLYHTGISGYVTLDDLAEMVRKGDEFVVQDAKSGEDLTRSVLTQIIFEQENKSGESLLPVSFLRQLISLYNDSMSSVVPSYLELSLSNFMQEQEKIRDMMASSFGIPNIADLEKQTHANMKMFQDAFSMFNPFMAMNGTKEPEPAPAPSNSQPSTTQKSDLDAMKAQMQEMQKKLDEMSRG